MSDVSETITAIGGLSGLATAIVSLVIGILNRSKTDSAKHESEKATADAKQASIEALAAKTEAHRAMAKALDAIKAAEDAQTKAQVGLLELQLRVFISSRRDHIHSVARDMEAITAGRKAEDFTDTDKMRMKDTMERFKSAHEDFLGALEQACRHFQEGKVDVDAFRRMYNAEIEEVCKAPATSMFYGMMHPDKTSKFKAIWAIYEKWFHEPLKGNS